MYVGWISIAIGLGFIGIACYHLFYGLSKINQKQDTKISVLALRVSSWLVIGGFIMIFLGLLYLMGIVPWWS